MISDKNGLCRSRHAIGGTEIDLLLINLLEYFGQVNPFVLFFPLHAGTVASLGENG